jgi:hypothetical protein
LHQERDQGDKKHKERVEVRGHSFDGLRDSGLGIPDE